MVINGVSPVFNFTVIHCILVIQSVAIFDLFNAFRQV